MLLGTHGDSLRDGPHASWLDGSYRRAHPVGEDRTVRQMDLARDRRAFCGAGRDRDVVPGRAFAPILASNTVGAVL